MWLSLKIPDKATLLSHPSITILRYRLCATVSPAEKKFESELRGWRDHRPRRTTGLRASDRDLGEPVADPEPRRGYPPSLQARYSPANESVAVARRPFHAHTTYGSIGSVGRAHYHYEHDYWQIRTWTGQRGLGKASWREQAQRMQLWHSGAQSWSAERHSAGRVWAAQLCLSHALSVGRAARDSCTSRQLMPHHQRASAGRAARRHVNPAAQTARPARHGTSTCVQVAAVPRRRLVGASVAAGGAGRARHSPGGPDA